MTIITSIPSDQTKSPNTLKNDRLLRAIFRQPLDRTPIWILRQAGRYLPEYRRVRETAKDFMTLCKTPELACTVTLQPIQRFELDAAIIFSDILTIPDAYGLGLFFEEEKGPGFQKAIRSQSDILALPTLDPETELRYVLDAIRLTKQALGNKLPLIGFSGSPWTLATYMIEGKSSKQFQIAKRFLYQEPALLHQLLDHLSKSVTDYLLAQIKAGVDVVMLFDSWAGLLPKQAYLEFSLQYMKKIIDELRSKTAHRIPLILFSKNAGVCLPEMSESGADVLGIDWQTDLNAARSLVGARTALQGNLDPAVLFGDLTKIEHSVKEVLEAYGPGSGHIFNLGHGVLPESDPEKVAHLIQTVQKFSPAYHKTL